MKTIQPEIRASSTLQAGHTKLTPTLDPASNTSALKSHPAPHIHAGDAKAELTGINSKITSEEVTQDAESVNLTGNEQLSPSHTDTTQDTDEGVITKTPSVRMLHTGQTHQPFNVVDEDATTDERSSLDSTEAPIASPYYQPEKPTAPGVSSENHLDAHVGQTVSTDLISGSTTSTTVYTLSDKGNQESSSSSSVITSSASLFTSSPSSNIFTTAEVTGDVTEESNISLKKDEEKMEDKMEMALPKATTTPFPGEEQAAGSKTKDEMDPESEEEAWTHAEAEEENYDEDTFQSQTILHSQPEPPHPTVKAASQRPAHTARFHEAGLRPGRPGQRVSLFAFCSNCV